MVLHRGVWGLLGGFCLLLAGCGGASSVDLTDRTYAIEQLRTRLESPSRSAFYRRIEDLLPNRLYREDDGPAMQVSTRAVVGEFVDAEPGFGFSADGQRLAFEDAKAAWKTIHFSLRVDESLGGDGKAPARVGLAVDGGSDYERTRDGFISLGRVGLLLTASPVFAYEGELLAIVEDGGMLLWIDGDERLSLPFIEPSRAASLLKNTDTLKELRQEASKKSKTVQLRREDGDLKQPPEE